jgi:hypothetical protein
MKIAKGDQELKTTFCFSSMRSCVGTTAASWQSEGVSCRDRLSRLAHSRSAASCSEGLCMSHCPFLSKQ